MRGSVLITYEEGRQSFTNPYYEITINGTDTRDFQFSESNSQYSTYIFSGDTLNVTVSQFGYGESPYINIFLTEYTNDDEDGDNGIKTTQLTGVTSASVTLTINPSANCYDFNVTVSAGLTQGCAPIGTISGATAYTCEIKTKNIGVQQVDIGDIYVGLITPSTTNRYDKVGGTSGFIGSVFRLDKNYDLDTTFDSRTSLGNSYFAVNDIEIQNDGRVIVGGGESAVSTGFSLNRLTRTGSLDGTFTRYNFNGGTNSVLSVVQQSDGKIVASGAFTQISGVTYNRYARFNYNGTIDNTYYSGVTNGFASSVKCDIDVRNDKIYFFGESNNTFNSSTFGCLLRLNTNGQLDNTFGTGGSASFSNTVGTALVTGIKILSNGKILCIGRFNRYNGQPCPSGVVILNEDGTLDTTFNSGGSGLIFSNTISILELTETLNQDEDKYLIVGNFTGATYNGVSVPSDIFFINSDGTLGNNTDLGIGISGTPRTCKLLSNGSYIITGELTSVNGVLITNGDIVQLSSTGQLQNC